MNHTKLINELIRRNGYTSYLEIGVQNTANNFDKIKCECKEGVDPEVDHPQVAKMTSDKMFETFMIAGYDIIFIDGLHHAEQVQRDFENSLKHLTPNGCIIIHDCLPKEESTTHVPRDSKVWHGDVYKFVMQLGCYGGIDFETYDFDEGCCLVWIDRSKRGDIRLIKNYEWQDYLTRRHELMRIKEWQ